MIKLIKSAFYNELEMREKLAKFVMETDMFSMSKECKKFEENFAAKQERKYAVFVNSGSSANLVLIQSLLNLGKLKKGDKIGVSSLTWGTNVMPLIQLGLLPVAIDVERETLNISSKTLKNVQEQIQGLFITNALGFCGDINNIKTICEEKNIIFIEDNCEALGSKAYEKLLGNFGLASTFSFFLGHHLSTIEGGMICTDDDDLRDMLVVVRAHAWDRNLSAEKQNEIRKNNKVSDFYSKYSFYDLGYNVRPTEINGFIGNEQLKYWDEVVNKRAENFLKFNEAVSKNDDIIMLKVDHMDIISNFGMPLIFKTKEIFERYKKKFDGAGVEIRPIISGDIEKQPFYQKYVSGHVRNNKNAQFVHENGFYFGNNPELNDEEINFLIGLLGK